jgi:hypothetical protein
MAVLLLLLWLLLPPRLRVSNPGLTYPSPKQFKHVCSPVAPHMAHAVMGMLLIGIVLKG